MRSPRLLSLPEMLLMAVPLLVLFVLLLVACPAPGTVS